MSNNLYKTIAVSALLMFGITALSTSAFAQSSSDQVSDEEYDDDLLEEVIVTGSILKRSDDGYSPVTIMTDEFMQDAGINTVSQALQLLPANNAGTIVNGWNNGSNFATGATAPALRGLTVQDTLSIVDGLRMAPYPLADDGQRNFVDLNTIANSTVQRIEVLRDGASSTYGADAIAGVINVITKKDVQGVHVTGSLGFSQAGGQEEQNFDVLWGFGDLQTDGQNFYVGAEYMHQDELWARDLDAPFNTGDWTTECGPSGSCLPNLNLNGVTPESGYWYGQFGIPGVALVRPMEDGAATGSGNFSYLNPGAGCRQFTPVTVSADQAGVWPTNNCEVDNVNHFQQNSPEIERKGLSMRYTAIVNDKTEFYAMANYYLTDTRTSFLGVNLYGLPTPPRPAGIPSYNIYQPVYVCSEGRGTFDGLNTGCDETNGQLNPYNPFAADGLRAELRMRNPLPREIHSKARAYRVALGFDGSFGDDWRYAANFTSSEVSLKIDRKNYATPQNVMDLVARGAYNFYEPGDNTQATLDTLAGGLNATISNTSVSRLWQVQATIAKDLMELAGGSLQGAIGASYRYESIDAPSFNPQNDSAPYSRYYGLNAVGTAGDRNVTSVFFEIDAPLAETFDVVFSGRYDDYSSGQSNFSPKAGIKWTPLDPLILRATWSQGFRIPSFNEAFGLPTTGYVTRNVDCSIYIDWCASHDNNAYATGSYGPGLTQTGDPALDPEQSDSLSFGAIWQVTDNFQMTIDFWKIKIDGLIAGVTNTSDAEDQYYLNNGVVDIPGITVIPGIADAAFPNALPIIGFIQSAYANQDSQTVQGIDFSATYAMQFGNVDWVSSLSVAYLDKYELTTQDGDKLSYAGTLSPCNITSCSGSPKWRGNWTNSFQFTEQFSSTLTTYYTSGYDEAAIDFGGVKGDCEASIYAYVQPNEDGTPNQCIHGAQWNIDLTVQYRFNNKVQLYADFLNLFDIKAKFDPSAAYQIYGYNPAWSSPNALGRYFRFGVRLDFE